MEENNKKLTADLDFSTIKNKDIEKRKGLQSIDEILDEYLEQEDLKKIDEIEDSFIRGTIKVWNLDFNCTCTACPEQYDVYYKDKYIAYVRKRYGSLKVHRVVGDKIMWDDILYEEQDDDRWSGVINDRDRTLAKIAAVIRTKILCI